MQTNNWYELEHTPNPIIYAPSIIEELKSLLNVWVIIIREMQPMQQTMQRNSIKYFHRVMVQLFPVYIFFAQS